MGSRWLPDDPLPVVSTACGRQQHRDCETPHCGCTCHLSNAAERPDGR